LSRPFNISSKLRRAIDTQLNTWASDPAVTVFYASARCAGAWGSLNDAPRYAGIALTDRIDLGFDPNFDEAAYPEQAE
jgi:hypothetical protein